MIQCVLYILLHDRSSYCNMMYYIYILSQKLNLVLHNKYNKQPSTESHQPYTIHNQSTVPPPAKQHIVKLDLYSIGCFSAVYYQSIYHLLVHIMSTVGIHSNNNLMIHLSGCSNYSSKSPRIDVYFSYCEKADDCIDCRTYKQISGGG